MVQELQVKTKSRISSTPSATLQTVLEELRLLRSEIMLLLPQEDFEDSQRLREAVSDPKNQRKISWTDIRKKSFLK